MIYYILLPGDTEDDCINDANQLGHISFGKFHKNEGFSVLHNLVQAWPHMIDQVRIIDSEGTKLSISDFLDIVQKH